MSWLCIDTHLRGQSRLGLLGATGWLATEEVTGRAHNVLIMLAKLHRVHASEITGVVVVEGPGSFSAIRTGVLHANLYARLRNLPLYPIRPEVWLDPVRLAEELAKGKYPSSPYVAPLYDQEPNITTPSVPSV